MDKYLVTCDLKTYLDPQEHNRCASCEHIGGLREGDPSGICFLVDLPIENTLKSVCYNFRGHWVSGDDDLVTKPKPM